MANIESISDLVNLWSTRAELVADLKKAFPDLPVSVDRVHKWAEKQSIRACYLHPLLVVSQNRGFPVTAEMILRLNSPVEDAV